jgi:hypothetical protein
VNPQKCGTKQLEIIQKAVRYFAMAKFLSDVPNDELMAHDLPARYVGEWGTATPKRREQMLDWSKRHGHNGYNIGVMYKVIANAGRLSRERPQTDSERELEYAHIRTGHLHAVRFGTGKKDVKLLWYRPQVIRADLPFKV